jgi:Family of unknown function (DUF6308)
VELVFGAGHHDRVVDQVEDRLVAYRRDVGLSYLDYKPATPSDHLYPEDLAVTLLISSRAGPAAFKSVQAHGASLKFVDLPQVTLEESSGEQRGLVADFIARMTAWPGFGASVATKVLHKKRPELIPILDNQAIFGAYMYDESDPFSRLLSFGARAVEQEPREPARRCRHPYGQC